MSNKLCYLTAALLLSLPGYRMYGQEMRLTVDELFRLADLNSKSIRMAETAALQAAEEVKGARAQRLPSLEASLSLSYLGDGWIGERNFSGGQSAPIPHFGNNLLAEATQVVYAGGSVAEGVKMAELRQRMASESLSGERQRIRFMLLEYYLELYRLNNLCEVYRKNIGQTELLLEHAEARRAQGTVLANDITRYELQLEQLRLALSDTESRRHILNFHLVTLLSLPEDTTVVPDGDILETGIPPLKREEWQRRAAEALPRLEMAALEVEMNRGQERLTRSLRLPQIALTAANHLDGPILIEVPPINRNFNYWYVGIGIRYDFGALWKSRSRSRADRYATLRAQQSLELAQQEARISVTTSYVELQQAYEQLRTQQKSVELAVQNYGTVNSRYISGMALVTDMTDASNTQLTAELMLINARINVVYSYYKLQLSAGVL